MLARLACLAALILAADTAQAQRLPAVYLESGGASGLYALGVEQTVFTSASGNQRFSVRAGAGYWTERGVFFEGRETFVSVPLAATASFQIARLPAQFEATGGFVFGYERNTIFVPAGADWTVRALPFGEAALRVPITRRFFARGGAVIGGRQEFVVDGGVAPVLGVGVQL